MGDHLDADLDLATLAEVAHLSPYHFHRIYAGMTGETAAEMLRRLRLHRAAGALIGSQAPVIAIARKARLRQCRRLHPRLPIGLWHAARHLSAARLPGDGLFGPTAP